jgi:hypothetical protein
VRTIADFTSFAAVMLRYSGANFCALAMPHSLYPRILVTEAIINSVSATPLSCPLLEDVLFIASCLGSVKPSSSSIYRILRKLL